MSQYTPHEPAASAMPYPEHPQDQPAYGQGAPGYPPAPQKTNTMAILGLIFAFVFSPLGIVFSAIGLSQIKKRREGGRGLALAGLILSIVFTLLFVIAVIFFVAVAQQAVEAAATAEAETEAAAPAAPVDPDGVLAACEVIVPAMLDFETQMGTVATPEEFALVIGDARATLEGAAATTTDPVFIEDVQVLSADLQQAADAVSAGEDPSFLVTALTEHGTTIDTHCVDAGYVD